VTSWYSVSAESNTLALRETATEAELAVLYTDGSGSRTHVLSRKEVRSLRNWLNDWLEQGA
jgi:hypothetical protein